MKNELSPKKAPSVVCSHSNMKFTVT